jgi:hypothetical protein
MPDIRVFVVDGAGTVQDAGAIDDQLVSALDILLGDKMPLQRAADLVAASRRLGRDPEADARHLVKLRKAYREVKERP